MVVALGVVPVGIGVLVAVLVDVCARVAVAVLVEEAVNVGVAVLVEEGVNVGVGVGTPQATIPLKKFCGSLGVIRTKSVALLSSS